MAGKRNISYVQNDEPAFIKAFKQKTGYKEDSSIDAKREKLEYEEDDRSDTEEEKPVVVVLRTGDLTAEEVEKVKKEEKDETDKLVEDGASDGKITFKKPTKKSEDESTELHITTIKKQKDKKSKKKSSSKEVKNASLLSFGDEEDEES